RRIVPFSVRETQTKRTILFYKGTTFFTKAGLLLLPNRRRRNGLDIVLQPLTAHSFKSMRRQPEWFQVDEVFLASFGAAVNPRLVVARLQNVAQIVEDFIVRGRRTLAEQSSAGRW